MKKYLEKKLLEERKKLATVTNKKDFNAICRNIIELELMINNYSKRQTANYKYLSMGNTTFVNKDFYGFIREVVYLYSNIPLLETESSISYPLLNSIKNADNNELFTFWNQIYNMETSNESSKLINTSNTIVFDKAYKRFNINKGKCLVYKDFFKKKNYVLLEKYNNIRDYIIPCGKAIELLYPFTDYGYNNTSVILSSYLNNKGLQELKKSSKRAEAEKLELIQIDNLAFEAKYLNKLIQEYDYSELTDYIKGRLLSFINSVIGFECSKNNSIEINDIINEAENDKSDIYILNSFRNNETSILNGAKMLIKEMK